MHAAPSEPLSEALQLAAEILSGKPTGPRYVANRADRRRWNAPSGRPDLRPTHPAIATAVLAWPSDETSTARRARELRRRQGGR